MIYYLGIIFIYLSCFFKWKSSNKSKKKVKFKINVIEQTMKDYSLNRSSLVHVEEPIPKYDNEANNTSPVELEYIDDSSSQNLYNKNNSKKNLLHKLNKFEKENELK